MTSPKLLSSQELPTAEAKWITLKKLTYSDADGKKRFWEVAERKTRSTGGIDAVAILALLQSRKNSFPISTLVIEQYRPPIDKFIIELPAGLIDQGESPEDAAVRELEEETGYKADKVIDTSPLIVSDPGMTNANMKLVTVSVWFEDDLQSPAQKLEDGEQIVTKVVPLSDLHNRLLEYDSKGFVVDARLSHLASGYQLAKTLAEDKFC